MSLILGIDEVGRGAWAGPLAVGAVVLDSQNVPTGLRDSKKLTKIQRAKLSREIKKSAIAIGLGWVNAKIIDQLGLSQALKLATESAFSQIPPDICDQLNQIIIDGNIRLLDDPRAVTLIHADDQISAVSAAAIIAKVFRDHYMVQLDAVFQGYDFVHHVGYGTVAHLKSLQKFGVIPSVHRASFAPVKSFCHCHLELNLESSQQLDFPIDPENDKNKLSRVSQTLVY